MATRRAGAGGRRVRRREVAFVLGMLLAASGLAVAAERLVSDDGIAPRAAERAAVPEVRPSVRRSVARPETVRIAVAPDAHLSITLPPDRFVRISRPGDATTLWRGCFDRRGVTVEVSHAARTPSPETEPQDLGDTEVRRRLVRVERRFLVEGEYGWTPYAEIVEGSADGRFECFTLLGLFERHEWTVRVRSFAEIEDGDRDRILAFLCSGVAARGKRRDPEWTQAEIDERLAREIPDRDLRSRLSGRVRTEHFLLLGHPKTVRALAPEVEAAYARTRRLFPFQEVRGRRLLPVFVFPTKDDYVAFGRGSGLANGFVERAAGHARGDLWVSYGEPMSVRTARHETAHQLVGVRVRHEGGGSWWQEGLAEYAEMSVEERARIGRHVLAQTSRPTWAELIRVRSLLDEDRWPSSATYAQAASIVAFLRDGPWGRERFDRLRERMADVRWNDPEGAERAFREVYGIPFADAESAWTEWVAGKPREPRVPSGGGSARRRVLEGVEASFE